MSRRLLLKLIFFIPVSVQSAQRKQRKPRKLKPQRDNSPLKAVPKVSQRIQNEQADQDGLERLQNDKDFDELKKDKRLIPLSVVPGLKIRDLDKKWHFCRPWTAQFLEDLVEAHRKEKNLRNRILFITSAVRTSERQVEIAKRNPNAVEADDDSPSAHLTGAAIDITKRGMPRQQIEWMRRTLQPLHGKMIYVVEEFRQPCFHIMVYKNYRKPANW